MEIINEATCSTSDSEAVTHVQDFIGTQQAHCYLINHDAHGYAKFVIDERSINALETGLHKIKSSLDRKQIYSMLYDMTISGKVPCVRVLDIINKNTQDAETEDVIVEVYRGILPLIIKKFVPAETLLPTFDRLFKSTYDLMLSGLYKQSISTQELLFTSMIDFAQTDETINIICDIFMTTNDQ